MGRLECTGVYRRPLLSSSPEIGQHTPITNTYHLALSTGHQIQDRAVEALRILGLKTYNERREPEKQREDQVLSEMLTSRD